MSAPVVVLAGGTGGAKLARGMLDVVGGERLVVVANVGDDIEIYGAYVSPDPDLVSFWLADRIDERGWGLAGDTFAVMEGLRELGVDVWFQLGDRDLAVGIDRAQALHGGATLTEAHVRITRALGLTASVLPATDQPVRTRVMSGDRWWPFQEYMIRTRGAAVQDVDIRGASAAAPSSAVLEAISTAQAIIVGPSNPIVSIEPILRVGGMRAALRQAPAPVVAVSPLVGGQVLKGPTAEFLRWARRPVDSDGIASLYEGLIDGFVADSRCSSVPALETSVLLDTAVARAQVARETLDFALALRTAG